MSARQEIVARFRAARNGVFASHAGKHLHVIERCFPTRAVSDNIRRSWAMARIRILRVAFLLTMMYATIQSSIARIATIKHSSPVLQYCLPTLWMMIAQTLPHLALITAHDILLHLTTIASTRQSDLAWPTITLMAGAHTPVRAACHQGSADITTTPSRHVLRLCAALRRFVLATKARLCRSHM